MVLKLSELRTDVHNDWCPACGYFGIEAGLTMALTELPIDVNKLALYSVIGCDCKIVRVQHETSQRHNQESGRPQGLRTSRYPATLSHVQRHQHERMVWRGRPVRPDNEKAYTASVRARAYWL